MNNINPTSSDQLIEQYDDEANQSLTAHYRKKSVSQEQDLQDVGAHLIGKPPKVIREDKIGNTIVSLFCVPITNVGRRPINLIGEDAAPVRYQWNLLISTHAADKSITSIRKAHADIVPEDLKHETFCTLSNNVVTFVTLDANRSMLTSPEGTLSGYLKTTFESTVYEVSDNFDTLRELHAEEEFPIRVTFNGMVRNYSDFSGANTVKKFRAFGGPKCLVRGITTPTFISHYRPALARCREEGTVCVVKGDGLRITVEPIQTFNAKNVNLFEPNDLEFTVLALS